MGGSGSAPAFSAAYGANVIKRNVIPGLFGLMVFLGAIIGGKNTMETIGKDIVDPSYMNYIVVSIIFLAISIALLFANILGIPQSTSQATVFSVSAIAIYYNVLNVKKVVFEIIPTWFILPIISFFLSFFIGKYIYRPLRKKGYTISKKFNESPYMRIAIILSSLYVAFSIGTNNVANASGPLAVLAFNEMNICTDYATHVLILSTLIIAPNFAIGSSIFGNKVVQNTGKQIILFGRFEAVIISVVSASLLIFASLWKGIPTSLVQLNVGSILGIGVAKLGFKKIFKKTEVNRFFIVWIIAPIMAFLLTYFFIYLFDNFIKP